MMSQMRYVAGACAICLLLACCSAPTRPAGVPTNASAKYEMEAGWVWSWRRETQKGCADWSATDNWASVYLSAGTGTTQCQAEPGIDYLSGDALVFERNWPMPKLDGGQPCPHRVSPAQLAELQTLVREMSVLGTGAEKRVLRAVSRRLSTTDGSALTSDASGWCNDLKSDDYRRATRQENPWQNGD